VRRTTVEPSVRPQTRDVALAGVRGEGVWWAGWLNCLPKSLCRNVMWWP